MISWSLGTSSSAKVILKQGKYAVTDLQACLVKFTC